MTKARWLKSTFVPNYDGGYPYNCCLKVNQNTGTDLSGKGKTGSGRIDCCFVKMGKRHNPELGSSEPVEGRCRH